MAQGFTGHFVTYLQLLIKVCFSTAKIELCFPISLSLHPKEERFFSCDPRCIVHMLRMNGQRFNIFSVHKMIKKHKTSFKKQRRHETTYCFCCDTGGSEC